MTWYKHFCWLFLRLGVISIAILLMASCSPKTVFVFDSTAIAEYDRPKGLWRVTWIVHSDIKPLDADTLAVDTLSH